MTKVIFSWSGGKDSALALYEIRQNRQYEIVTLLTTVTEGYDRVSMHGVRRALIEKQAQSLGLPLAEVFIPQVCSNEEYETRMKDVLTRYRTMGVDSVVFGDIFLADIRKYREDNLARLEMKGVFPLWARNTRELVESFISLGFQAITTCVDTKFLNKRFIGRTLDAAFLAELPSGVDPGGENGEFHSFVFAGPIFKQPVNFDMGEVVLRDSFYFADLIPERE
ncbi:MAG: diphthine--ammonia ligase [Dehalococcoidales bacterium]|nr:diphthine--ammonia ligase [Dehalococcoidales bacterium]